VLYLCPSVSWLWDSGDGAMRAFLLGLALLASSAGAQSRSFWISQSSARSPRWIFPFYDYAAGGSQAAGAGRVLGSEFQPLGPCNAAGIAYEVGSVSNGNVRVGIYGPATAPEEMAGTAVIAESADTAQGSINTGQTVLFATPVSLAPGSLYYAAIEFSSATGTFLRIVTSVSVTGFLPYYDRSGGYGALTNPAPAVLHNINALRPVLKVLCQ
jgi:hypothetical protein